MDFENLNGLALRNLAQLNVVLGKNGCGKSFLLKQADVVLTNQLRPGIVRYISPERAGEFRYDPGLDQNMAQDPNWFGNTRRLNQVGNFKQQSATQLRRLEVQYLRALQDDHTKPGYEPRHFDHELERINALIERVGIRAVGNEFEIFVKETGVTAQPDAISSGESQLLSLAIEFLAFARGALKDQVNVLLIDEPDVHLHPDLQERLARFIVSELAGDHIVVILATHSTSLLSAFAESENARVAFMQRGNAELIFHPVTDVLRDVLPMFGAHPLSNVFAKSPILIVEGEDDVRIWQQAGRTSHGAIRTHPCEAGSINQISAYETASDAIISAVYDNAVGYSLRDRDEVDEHTPLEDVGRIIRMRLRCRAAENLMLSNDALALAGTDWDTLKARLVQFADASPDHRYHAKLRAFIDGGFDRLNHNLKDIRMILAGQISNKPWEVLVGQALASARLRQENGLGSLRNYLGEKACEHLLDR